MRGATVLLIPALLAGQSTAPPAAQPPAPDRAATEAALRATALDYIEGWYEGDAARMERALHPELAKRIVRTDAQGRNRLDQMSALTLINGVRAGGGRNTPKERQQKDVTILDVYENAASVKVVASDWIDYLHLAKWNGQWKIVNVLWELKPQPRK
ncbi:MAG TPA: nuclear transport factor 2 family protein [Holophagaceae bacterium]|nr:nuclear transport factor 2 family protein [Holophagaceae bacterium]